MSIMRMSIRRLRRQTVNAVLQSTAALLLTVTVLASCAVPPERRPTTEAPERFNVVFRDNGAQRYDTIPAPIDSVWRRMPDAYREIGLPGAAASGPDLVYLTPHLELNARPLYQGERTSDYIDCGSSAAVGERADYYSVTFVLISRLRPVDENRTLIESLIDGHAQSGGNMSNSVPCFGKGRLERQLAGILKRPFRR